MDAITLLKDDHKTVEQLFKRFEKTGDRAYAERRQLVDRMIEELAAHAAIEEQLFYPVARAAVPETEDIALESLEEHHIVKWVLSELEAMAPTDERFRAKVTVLIENVRHHVKEEENDFFPKVRDELGRSALTELGDAMVGAKKVAPTHPHPRAPDAPPANLLAGATAGVADRIGDTVSGLAQGGVSAVGDIIAAVLRRQKPRVSPTGSRVARKTAAKVRGSQPVRATKKAGVRAKPATKRAAGSAKRASSPAGRAAGSAKRASSPAKRASTSAGRTTIAATKRVAKSTGRAGRSATKKAGSASKG